MEAAPQTVAVAYIRVSDPRQATDGNSLTSQERYVREYAGRLSYALLRLFVEEGESAKTDDRTALKELLAFLTKNKGLVQVVIVPKIDRFAREAFDYLFLRRTLKTLGIRLESTSERLEDTPSGRLHETMLAAFAQFDNEQRTERSKGGMVEAVREGRFVWKAPVGYANVRAAGNRKGGTGNIAPDQRTAPVIIAAFTRLASRRETPEAVRGWMSAQGIRMTRSGFHSMVHNPLYMGVIEAFGETNPAKPPFVPLVSESLFFGARGAFHGKNRPKVVRPYVRENPAFPLRGTLRCTCGRYFCSNFAQGTHARFAYYRCLKCREMNLGRDAAERRFFDELATFLPDAGAVSRLKARFRSWHERDGAGSRAGGKRIDAEIAAAKELRTAISLKNAGGVIPDDVAREQISKLGVRLAKLEADRKNLAVAENDTDAILDFAEEFLKALPGYWRHSGLTVQKKLQSFLYPNGLVYTKDRSLQTTDYPLLEGVKSAVHGGVTRVVEPSEEEANEILGFFAELKQVFGGDCE